ncbi:MAG TPA: PIG-L family deacetylase [Clostridia bacterium]|nr:PIG-L family deacetylase [Clostridia bacterium]
MELNKQNAEIFVPDKSPIEAALARTTALCVTAHQDDIEIMAFGPIVECFAKDDKWFTGVVVTDGAGSPRSGVYEKFTDEAMKEVRAQEQKTAASIGQYSAQVLMDYKSAQVKDPNNEELIKELAQLIKKCQPDAIYTHNLADKHDTHVAVALRVISAVRSLPVADRPTKVYSLEVWRGLDWLCDEDKSVFDTSTHTNLAAALLGVHDSQIAGGKRYDLATLGRRNANATFFASHDVDATDSVTYGLDITDLVNNEDLSPAEFINGFIDRFKNEITTRIERMAL